MSVMVAQGLEVVYGQIEAHLRALRLPGVLARYRASAEEMGLTEEAYRWLEEVLAAERASREEHRLARNLQAARMPVIKELGSFDFAAQPSVSRPRVLALAEGQFIAAHESVILAGVPGTGNYAKPSVMQRSGARVATLLSSAPAHLA